MTITTERKNHSQPNFSQHSDSSRVVSAASILSGTALAAYGITRRGWTGTALIAGGAYLAYRGLGNATKPYTGAVRISYTIAKGPNDVYVYLRNSENWARFLQGLSMEATGGDSLKLTFGETAGFEVISEAKITDEEPGKFIAWSSAAGPLQHRGVVHFKAAPGERGTEVSLAFEFKVPAGPVGRAVAQLVGWDPEQLARESLRQLKELMEAGEIPTTGGQPVGARGLKGAALRVLYREAPVEDSAKTRMAGD